MGIIAVIIASMLFCSFIASADINLWIHSDTHYCEDGCEYPELSTQLPDMISDMENDISIHPDVIFMLGDILDANGKFNQYSAVWKPYLNSTGMASSVYYLFGANPGADYDYPMAQGNWHTYIDNYGLSPSTSYVINANRPYEIVNKLDVLNSSCVTGWYTSAWNETNYVIEMGNIAWIFISNGVGECKYEWFYDQISYYSNCTEKDWNVLICSHHAYDFTANPAYDGECNTHLRAWLTENVGWHQIIRWFHGHRHYFAAETRLAVHGASNVTWQLISAIDEAHQGEERHSYFFNITNGSKTVTYGDYRHDIDAWDPGGNPGNGSFQLNYAFIEESESESEEDSGIEFISLNEGTNGTTIFDSTPTFNWTIVANTSRYQLQIANDSAFTELVVNLSDINEFEYPSEHDSNETRVSFTLPVANSLDTYQTYYCRVRAYI